MLEHLVRSQDWVVHRDQAVAGGHSAASITHRLRSRRWTLLLPGVYLCSSGEPSRRQQLLAATLYAGPFSAIDGIDACRFHGLRVATQDDLVHVVVPWGDPARSRGFVKVRRTTAPIRVTTTQRLRYLDAPSAVVAAARRARTERQVLALLSEALQRRVVTYEELVAAHVQGGSHNAQLTDRVITELGSGARSVPEVDFLRLAAASLILPPPICNALMRLPDGRVLSPDALWEDAGLIHETNGRVAHARDDLFEDMQERHDVLTAAGLTILHSSPRQLALKGREVIGLLERCYVRLAGRGLPPGVTLLGLAA